MPYLGRGPGFGIRQKYFFTASASDTSVSGSDNNGLTLTFTDGLFIDVYLNGVLLDPNSDYNTSTANTVAGLASLSANDFIEVVAYDSFSIGDVVSASSGGTFSGAVASNGNITSAATVSGVAGTFSGDVTGLTLNATGDTSAGDNAAIGFTSTEGLILTGQGSTSDIAIKNDADSLVASVATGTTIMNFESTPTAGSVAVKVAGKESMWVPALAMKPTVSNGCAPHASVETTSGRPDLVVLDFDKDSDEFAQFNICFPKSWNEGTITYQVYWSGIAATTGVAWTLAGVAVSDNGNIDVAFGTAIVVQDDSQGAVEEVCATAESSAVTIAGSPAAGDLCFFALSRDVSDSNDDMNGDARLLGVKIFFTTDAANDA